jgi:hypothetical protein
MMGYNLLPTILMPTRFGIKSNTLIDHIYYFNRKNKIYNTLSILSGNIFSDISDHLPNFMIIKTNEKLKTHKENRPKIRIYSKLNNEKFNQKLNSLDWSSLYNTTDANDAYNGFISKIITTFNECYPLVTLSRRGSKDKAYITENLKKCCHKKNKLYKKWIKSSTQADRDKYKNYARILKQLVKASETDYYQTMFEQCKNDSKKLWKNLNHICSYNNKKRKTSNQINKLLHDNKTITDSKGIAETFNHYFCNVASNINKSIDATNISHMSWMKNSNQKSIFLEAITYMELSDLKVESNDKRYFI